MRLGRLGNMVTIARQITVILLVWGLSFILQKILHIPIASGVLGFFILLLLLHFKGLKLTQVEQGADVLLADLPCFLFRLWSGFFNINSCFGTVAGKFLW